MTLYIRPTGYYGVLTGFALCRTNDTVLVDEHIVEHFPKEATGKEIKKVALDAGFVTSEDEVIWGKVIN